MTSLSFKKKPLVFLFASFFLTSPVTVESREKSPPSEQHFDAWTRRCTETTTSAKQCILYQTYVGKNKNTLLVAEIAADKKSKEHIMQITVPFGILLLAPLQIAIDNRTQAELPYVQCQPNGCTTSVSLPSEFIDKLKAGRKMTLKYALPDQSFIEASLSLHGITAGLKSLASQGS